VERVLTGVPVPPSEQLAAAPGERVALVDLLDRLLAGGVVITGDVTISIANVDLVRISLRAVIASIRPEIERRLGDTEPPRGTAW
jgi:gas vesicle protein GvpA/GvpJ/GvpM family